MKTLPDLLPELSRLPAVAELARATQHPARLRCAPLIGAARPALVAALATHNPAQCLLFVAGSGDAALRSCEDLRHWCAPAAVLLYPASDALPYEHMSPGADVLRQRLAVLAALRERAHIPPDELQPLLIVAPLRALLQPILTPDEYRVATTVLSRGDEYNQDALLQRWLDLGYQSLPTVEEPGELSRRGGIVDIWPADSSLPLRVEWFGDEIDSLRFFDPATQRSEQRVDQATVAPPHEYPLWQRETALARLRALDTASLRPEARDEWEASLERLALGERFEGRAFYAPFFRTPDAVVSLTAHLPAQSVVLLSEGLLLSQMAGDLRDQAESQRTSLVETGELPAGFPRPYLCWEELGLGDWRWGATAGPAGAYPVVDLSNNEAPGASEAPDNGNPPLPEPPQPDVVAPGFVPADLFGGQLRRFVNDVIERLRAGTRVVLVTPQAARMQELVDEAFGETGPPAQVSYIHGGLDAGWHLPELNLTLYTDTEIFGWRQRRALAERRRRKQRSADERATFLRGLKLGDYVVHIEHGIAVFDGMIRRTVGEIEREYLVLRYAAGDKIYVPVDQVDRIARYVGAGDSTPQLTRLGTQEWERAKRKARAAVQDLAEDLLALYAQRQLSSGHAFGTDNDWQRELEGAFPYIETDDQLRALTDVKHDMELEQPMDRLICGDVGFGKTEVALRAAFKAVQDNKQVAVLVPTTVLAQQHYDTFTRRMAAFPVTVEMLSRFRTTKEQNEIVSRTARGQVDILIGTHRLLSRDVSFKDLGLVVVDEEQRFGVRHKERLKQLRAEVDVLTLTATPIPRTLHMSLAGIRDLSVIDTPPEDRVPIKTYVAPHDDNLIRDAILREMDRGGQVYFVHNRVHSIYHVANKLRMLVPEANIGVGHGQLEERQLEKVMFDFFAGEYDVLVCTTIIESGLDVPNANTIIIDDATHYGLAQLYQLRGRVGRSANRAYAYLLYRQERAMGEEAQQRLQAIQEATELGAGFRIAMRDLEIRGAGNLLGAEQSGHIAAVGFDLYSRLLEQAVKQLKSGFAAEQAQRRAAADNGTSNGVPRTSEAGKKVQVSEKVLVAPLVTLDLPLTAYLPPDYIPDETLRLSVYQRMVEALDLEEVRAMRQELRDRFGEPPQPALHLLTWLQIKALALRAGVTSVISNDDEFIVRLPAVDPRGRERLRRRFGRDATVKIGPQFVRLNRRALEDNWTAKLVGVLEALGGGE